MYGHPALVISQARALAPSLRAFNCWFRKEPAKLTYFLSPSSLPPHH